MITIKDYPKQGTFKDKRVVVCFDYDTSASIGGVCVRDDVSEPHLTIIKLDDGRHVLGTECQYRGE